MDDADEVNNGSMEWEMVSTKSEGKESCGDNEINSVSSNNCSENYEFDSIQDELEATDLVLSSSFDINVLKEAMKNSAEALELVNDRDVVAVVGKTGVGKSTLLQGIAGKKIRQSIHRTTFAGQTALKEVYEAEDALSRFEIGHDAKSKTSHLNAYLRKSGKSEKETVYLDMPGMEDTNGVEMDIATCALLSQVAKRCKSLKFIMVIHCASLLEDRGGAFRAVLQFARKFVADFKHHKKSFMFLFSHSDEISSMSVSSQDAKVRIHDDIIQISEGSTDKDVLAVLQFIRESLKRGYPFADIFYPTMDYSALSARVEKKLTKFTELTLAKSCNLTTASKLKLDGAVQKLVQSLEASLRRSSPNLEKVSDVMSTIDYLHRFIEVDCVRVVAEEAKGIIEEYIGLNKSLIEERLLKGLNSNSEFSSEDVRCISDSLRILEHLDDSFSSEDWHDRNAHHLVEFSEGITRKVEASNLDTFHLELKTLSMWSNEFNGRYAEVYDKTCRAISGHIQAIANHISKGEAGKLDEVQHDEMVHYLKDQFALYDFCERVVQHSVKGINVDDLTLVKEVTTQELIDLMEAWVLDAEHTLEGELSMDDDDGSYKRIARRVELMDTIRLVMNDHSFICGELLATAESSIKQIQMHLVRWYAAICDSLKSTSFQSEWLHPLTVLKEVRLLFEGMSGAGWQEIEPSFHSVVQHANASVSSMVSDLVASAKDVRKNGVVNGKRIAEKLQQVRACVWFDAFFGSACVADCCASVGKELRKHIVMRSEELDTFVNDLTISSKRCSSIELLGSLLPELRQIDILNPSLQCTSSSLSTKCITSLQDHLATVDNEANALMQDWKESFVDGKPDIQDNSQTLNHILLQLQGLRATDASDDLVRNCARVTSFINDECKQCQSTIEIELARFGDFERKVGLLSSIKACQDSKHVSTRLPQFDKAQRDVRRLVSKEYHSIEDLIEHSSEWDKIEQRLDAFQDAQVLDKYLDEEVSHKLRSLHRMKEKKETQVDDTLYTMIRAHNFNAIGEFIAPLASSNDQVKKAKFESYRSEICASLEEIIHATNRLLNGKADETGRDVNKNLNVIITAHHELQELLYPRLDLKKELDILVRKANATLTGFVSKLFAAMKANDFIQMFTLKQEAAIFFDPMKQHFSPRNIQAIKSAKQETKAKLEAVPSYVDLFFSSSFKQDKQLAAAMSSLKDSKEITNKHLDELHMLYDSTKADIDRRARKILHEFNDTVHQNLVYEDVISVLVTLNRKLNGSLKHHCSSSLLNECSRILESIRLEKEKLDEWLNWDAERQKAEVQQISAKMDKIKSEGWSIKKVRKRVKEFFSSSKSAYESYQGRLLQLMDKRFNDAQAALKNRDVGKWANDCVWQ